MTISLALLLYCLATPLFWAGTNVFDRILVKFRLDNAVASVAPMLATLVATPFVIGYGIVRRHNLMAITPSQALHQVGSGILYIGAIVLYFSAIRLAKSGARVTPLWRLNTAFAIILGIPTGVYPTFMQILAVLAITYLALLLVIPEDDESQRRRFRLVIPWRQLIHGASGKILLLIALAALLFSISPFLFKNGAQGLTFEQAMFWQYVGVVSTGWIIAISPLCKGWPGQVKTVGALPALSLAAGSIITQFAGRWCFNHATLDAPIMVAMTLVGIQPFFYGLYMYLASKCSTAPWVEETKDLPRSLVIAGLMLLCSYPLVMS